MELLESVRSFPPLWLILAALWLPIVILAVLQYRIEVWKRRNDVLRRHLRDL